MEAVRAMGINLRSRTASQTPQSSRAEVSVTTSLQRDRPATRIQPRLPEEALDLLRSALVTSPIEAEAKLRQHATALSAGAPPWSLAVEAAFRLFADLLQQGWAVEVHRGEIWATAPLATTADGESLDSVKGRLRDALVAAKSTQLSDPAVRDFLRRMETPRLLRDRRVSILDLIDDGQSLAVEMTAAAALPPSERGVELDRIVRPVLQFATAAKNCEITGLPLLDVWRYFRHTWSLEYRPTPGRTLFLLVRNAARPNMPVMGIAALANALPQLKVRDNWIGWTAKDLIFRVRANPATWAQERAALLRTLEDAQALIRADDLIEKVGRATGAVLEERLLALAGAAAADRDVALRHRQQKLERGEAVPSMRHLPRDRQGQIDWVAASQAPLFVLKRARTLAAILLARRVVGGLSPSGAEFLEAAARQPDVMRALAITMKEIRKVGLASRMLELNVCGAVPPYRDLLVGKLVALSVATAEIADGYRERYGAQPSEIASQMAAAKVVRSPDLCTLTTTSLYGVAASQYNRLKVTAPTAVAATTIHWKDLGLTEGYGTVHLSDATVRALRRLSVADRGGRNVNNVFGEGNSPRLRQVREGLDALGVDSDAILKHSSARRVYGLEMFPGGNRSLCLNQAVPHVLPTFRNVANAWRDRWLSGRVTRRDVLARVARSGWETVHAELAAPAEAAQFSLFADTVALVPPSSAAVGAGKIAMPKQERVDLVQGLYRAASTCADHHDEKTVELLHIGTPVDDFILEKTSTGGVVFVTGNPGDGKTHLIRLLMPDLKAARAEVCLDANEMADDELLRLVDSSLRRKSGGCVVAINEGILVDLLRAAGDRGWAEETRRQLLHPLVYTVGGGVASAASGSSRAGVKGGPTANRVAVVDLNLRNNLGPVVVTKALQKLIELSAPCAGCPVGRCEGQVNAARLDESRVADRLVSLLDRVARVGYHATMRDLHGFLSYLLFAGIGCGTVKATMECATPYWQAAFEGGIGPLFDAVRQFDPARQPLPLLDDELWRHADPPDAWALPYRDAHQTNGSMDERRKSFVNRKRRAFFEHRTGTALLSVAGDAVDKMLMELLDPNRTSATQVVRLLNRFFDRNENRGDSLYLWTSHRYDARPNRFAAHLWSVPSAQLEVAIPRLPAHLESAFPDYRPDHAMLRFAGMPPEEGLRIDRLLLESLVAAEQGLPSTFRRGEPEARISTFYDRLAKQVELKNVGSFLEVRMVDTDTGANFAMSIDVTGRRYNR